MKRAVLSSSLLLGTVLIAQPSYSPVQYQSGAPPALPALAVGGGQVFAEVEINTAGRPSAVAAKVQTPPFTNLVTKAIEGWRFRPAMSGGSKAVPAVVLVAALFRAPALQGPTQGQPPQAMGTPSPEVTWPIATREPVHPPQARASGVVMVEVLVGESGEVRRARIVKSRPPFDAPALAAARQWSFRPARIGGQPTATYAYLIFGFPEPVIP
jgi:TonB family protein